MRAEGVIHGDCSRMVELGDGEVQLIVAGPPYWDYIDYEGYARGKRRQAIAWVPTRSYDAYLKSFSLWFRECFRVLERGRFCVVNVATLQRDGRSYPLPFHAVSLLEAIGFEFCFDIVWHKIAGGRRNARAFLQTPLPGNFKPNNSIEYLLAFRKPGPSSMRSSRWALARHADEISVDRFVTQELANNIWHILPAPSGPRRPHPCPFPPEIPHRLVRLLSLSADLVLDPFAGVGTTGRAARMLGRRFIGYELVAEFASLANRSLDEPLALRPARVARFDPADSEVHGP